MSFTVDTTGFARALRELDRRTDRSSAQNLERYARTTLSNRQGTGIVDLTPPGGAGARGAAAKRRGEKKIAGDLAVVFVPVRLKGKRKERWPDVAGIHRERFASPSRFAGKITRGQVQAYYVDRTKLRQLQTLLFGRIGRLASGWLAAALRLGVPVPAWVSRHGTARGGVAVQLLGPKKSIELFNTAPDSSPVAETERRLQQAVNYATSRIERDMGDAVAKNARAAGLRAA